MLDTRSCEEINPISKDLSIVLLFAQGYFYLMSLSALHQQIERLREIFADNGFQMPLASPATAAQIEAVEIETGIAFDADLREFYQTTNGSSRFAWLAVQTDGLTPCTFPTLEKCFEWWREWLPYDAGVHEQFGPAEDERDARLQPQHYVHRRWFPIAEFNGWGTTVFFDADLTSEGTFGQVIAYQHDPDAVYFVADSFLDFLILSNDLLQQNAANLLFVDGELSMWAPPQLQA